MAHMLSFDKNGVGQVFSVGSSCWHSEGHVLETPPSYEEAITLVGLDYPVVKMPYFVPGTKDNEDGGKEAIYTQSKDAYYTFRPDISKVLGSVGKNYTVVENREAFRPLQPLVDDGTILLETGGVLRDGADSWLMGRFAFDKLGPKAQELFSQPGEEIIPYATSLANHDGKRGILLGLTPTRIVCWNTLSYAETQRESRWETVIHQRDANERLAEAAERIFLGTIAKYEKLAEQYRLLKNCTLSQVDFRRLVLDIAAPDPRENPKFNPEAKLAALVVERAEAKRNFISKLWYEGKGHTGEPTAYYALQGLVEAIDHGREFFPTRAGCYRTASLLTGHLADIKNRVTDSVVNFALSTAA